MYLTAGLLLVPLVLFAALSVVPYVWSRMSWDNQVSSASEVRDLDIASDGATYEELVELLGEPIASGPGFEQSDEKQAGVWYWSTDDGEVRGLILRGRLAGTLKVGEWK